VHATLMRQYCLVRYLTVVRHAKTSPAGPGESDYVRTLNKRGRDECEQLRAWALDAKKLGQYGPTTALVSAAARTRETFRRAFHGTPFVAHCEFSELIYNGVRDVTAEDALIDLAAIDPVTTSLLVVAHNPTVLELMYTLATQLPKSLRNSHYPLGGAYVLALPGDRPVGLEKYEVVASFVPD
jgi:phosphohistidine phosphatase SixA